MRPARQVQSPLLVGRDELLVLADRMIDDAAAGRGRVLLLAGEAGIGKSRLQWAIIRRAEAAGFRLALGDLSPHDSQLSLAALFDMAQGMRDDPHFRTLGEELLAVRGGKGGDSLASRQLLVHDVVDLLIGAIDGPTLIRIDNLQWADELTLEVMSELARRAPKLPLLLVGAYRLDELPLASVHREWRSRILSQRHAEEARLRRLTYDETALVTSLIIGNGLPAPREVVAAVYERTDGNPLHVEELLAALPDEALSSGRAIREAHVPDTIEDAVLVRFARLTPAAQSAARAGAVIGRCFIPDVLAGLLDRPVTDLDAPLGELVEHGFLHPFQYVDRGYYDFHHQLLRDALYGTVPPGELRRLHARAAEFGSLLVGGGEVHKSVHYEKAGLRQQAYRAALAAAQAAAAVTSRHESFELYRRAAANVPDELPAAERAALYDGYVEAAFAVDDVEVGIETAHEARRWHLEAGEPIQAAEALVSLAGMGRRDVWRLADRRSIIDQAVEELEALPPSPERDVVLADALDFRARFAIDVNDFATAEALFDDIQRLDSSPDRVADVAYQRAEIGIHHGRVAEGLAGMLGYARMSRDANRESAGVTAFRWTSALATRVMDYPTAAVGLDEGLRWADEVEQSYCRHVMAATAAQLAWAGGRWDEAIPAAEIELVERGSRRGTLGSRDALGFVAFGRGDVERARTLLSDSLAIGRDSGEVELVLPPLWGLAETALVAGDPAGAIDRCEDALEIARAAHERPLLVPFVVTGVRAYLAARRPEAAESWLQRTSLELQGWERARAALDHGQGLVRLAAGSTVSARASLEAAVDGWDALGRIWEATWARLDLAACLVRGNRHLDALPVLAAVRDTAERLRSGPLLERVDELAGTARRRGTSDEPWWPLTTREFEIASHIAEGMTNAAIADELGLSPRTVGAHVEHILAKLGVARRAEIAAWVATVRAVPAGR
jgi:DNA-binding CsgD family transcriptional regulator/tetratricopeptide (TPR) repeat protein